MKALYYLACPYSDPDPTIRENRYLEASKVAGHLMQMGYHILSPISACHEAAKQAETAFDWSYWKEFDERLISHCNALVVLALPGIGKSVGTQAEIEIAKRLGKPVYVLLPSGEWVGKAPPVDNSDTTEKAL